MDPVTWAVGILALGAGAITTLLRIFREEGKFESLFKRIEANPSLVAFLEKLGVEFPKEKEPFEDRLQKLFSKFEDVSKESDTLLLELDELLHSKEVVINQLYHREKELTSRIESLKNSPEYTAARNQQLLEDIVKLQEEQIKSSRKESRISALRDFALYGLGVLTPYVLIWVAQKFGITLPTTP